MGCRWQQIGEDLWIPGRITKRPYPMLVRFYECLWCKDTKATLTSPDPGESCVSIPGHTSMSQFLEISRREPKT
jgi:hypothetical protein